MKKNLSALILFVLFNQLNCFLLEQLPDISSPNFSKEIYNDILHGADYELFGLKRNFDFTKWDNKNQVKIEIWKGDIAKVIDFINLINKTSKSAVLADRAQKLLSVSNILLEQFATLPALNASRNINKMAASLKLVYKVVNFEIPKALKDWGSFKTNNSIELEAKNLITNLHKLLQVIGTKIIKDYSITQEEALKQIKSMYEVVFAKRDFKRGIDSDLELGIDKLFFRIYFIVNFSNNIQLDKKLNQIKTLYFREINLINKLASNDLYATENLKSDLDKYLAEIKQLNSELDKIKIDKTIASKKAVNILKLLIKVNESIIKKIEITFVPTQKEIKSLIDKTFAGILDSNYDLSNGLNRNQISLFNPIFDKLKVFVDFFGSKNQIKNFGVFRIDLNESVFKEINKMSSLRITHHAASALFMLYYKAIKDKIYEAKKYADIIAILPKTREVKSLMLYLVNKYEVLFKKFEVNFNKVVHVS